MLRPRFQSNLQKESLEKIIISIYSTSSEYDSDDNIPQKQLPVTKNVPVNKPTITIDYILLSKTCDRYTVSDRAETPIASAALNYTASTEIIDKNKFPQKRIKTQEKVLKILVLYFDGQKYKILSIIEKDGQKNIDKIF